MSHEYAVMPKSDYTDACNAIRAKTGKSAAIKSGDMATEIASIETGSDYDTLLSEQYGSVIYTLSVSHTGTTVSVVVVTTDGVITYTGTTIPSTIATNQRVQIGFTADAGYTLPSTIGATNCTATFNTGSSSVISITNPTGNATVTFDGVATAYTITTSVTNGTYTGSSTISTGDTATVVIINDEGYDLPSTVSVSGASYQYANGIIALSNPTGNVTISATCPQSQPVSNAVTLTASGDWTTQYQGEISVTDTNNNVVWSQSPANKSAYPITLYLSTGTYYINVYGPELWGLAVSSDDFSGDYLSGFYINNNGSIDIHVDDFSD